VLLATSSAEPARSERAAELAESSKRISFLDVDPGVVRDALVGAMERVPAGSVPEGVGNTGCEPLVARDVTVDLFGERTGFAAVEARLCDRRIPAKDAPEVAGPPLSIEWIGQVRGTDDALLASAAFTVQVDEGGGVGQMTATFNAQGTTLSLWPVNEGRTYALVERDESAMANGGPPIVEEGDGAQPGPAEPARKERRTPARLVGSPGLAAQAPGEGPGVDGVDDSSGQPRPGGPPGNRTIQIMVGYANGMTAQQANLMMGQFTAYTNMSFVNSDMPVRAESLGPLATGYTQDATSINADLDDLANPIDGVLDDLTAWRSGGQLDTAILLVPVPRAFCGLAHLNEDMDAVYTKHGVVPLPTATCHESTYAHELGHIIGAQHDPEAPGTEPIQPWGYGHLDTGVGATVTAYAATGTPKVAQWSDPDDDFINAPGVPSGTQYEDSDRLVSDASWAMAEHGEVASNDSIWYRSASSHTTYSIPGTVGDDDEEAPKTPVTGDFDGDGYGDQLFYMPGKPIDDMYYHGAPHWYEYYSPVDVRGTYKPVVGDFDGDGRDDIFWYGPNSLDFIFWGTASRAQFGEPGNVTSVSVTSSSYQPVGGDFDGDGYGDVLWFGPGGASDWFWWGSATRGSFTTTQVSINGTYDHAFSGDVNGDGRDDIAFYEPGAAADPLWHGRAVRSEIGPGFQTNLGINSTYEPFSGDMNGDGRDDVFWYGPGGAADRIWWGQPTFAAFPQTGTTTTVSGYYKASIGDFDGNGYEDPYWFSFG
jgi:hypothetical protein